MEFLTVTELKNNMKTLIDEVASGKSLTITKKGKPVARIEPFTSEKDDILPAWKRKFTPIKIKSSKTSTEIIREMRDAE